MLRCFFWTLLWILVADIYSSCLAYMQKFHASAYFKYLIKNNTVLGNNYHPPTKLREGNVFSRVCHSVHTGNVTLCIEPHRTGTSPPWPCPLGYGTSLYRPPKPWPQPLRISLYKNSHPPRPQDMGPHCTENPVAPPLLVTSGGKTRDLSKLAHLSSNLFTSGNPPPPVLTSGGY